VNQSVFPKPLVKLAPKSKNRCIFAGVAANERKFYEQGERRSTVVMRKTTFLYVLIISLPNILKKNGETELKNVCTSVTY
jgi:hypothetical protein